MKKVDFQKRRYLVLSLIVFILFLIYLNRSYDYIYNNIQSTGLKGVYKDMIYSFRSSNDILANSSSAPLKYVALGDSLTYGAGTGNYQESYPYLVAANLAKNSNEKKDYILYEYSHPGDRSADLITDYLDKAILEQPDIITILIGVNDIHNQVSASDFKANYNEILSRLKRETKAEVYVINIPYIGADRLILPPYNDYFDYKTKKFNKIIYDLTLDYKVKYIDLYNSTSKLFKKSGDHYSADLFHPSAAGYAIWGQIIYDNINK
jgi:lysophospholipase L1-like esterase